MATSTTCDRCGDVIPTEVKPGKLSLVLVTNNPDIPKLEIGGATGPDPDLCAKCVPQVYNYIVERVSVGDLKDFPATEIGRRKRTKKVS